MTGKPETAPQQLRRLSSISANEIKPVSGNPSRTADTAKPLMKATWYPASAMSFVDNASKQPGMICRPGAARSARRRCAGLTQSLLQASRRGNARCLHGRNKHLAIRCKRGGDLLLALAAGNNPELGQALCHFG